MIDVANPECAELLHELRQAIAELSLISHVSGTSYDGKAVRSTDEDVGGRRPPGGDREPRPRAPKLPPVVGDASSEKAWAEYDDELAAWRACYQRRTPEYFGRELARCSSAGRLRLLRDEAWETLEAWRRTPLPAGQEPQRWDPQWKRFVAESKLDAGVLATRFGCSRRYVNKVRKAWRDGGSMPAEGEAVQGAAVPVTRRAA